MWTLVEDKWDLGMGGGSQLKCCPDCPVEAEPSIVSPGWLATAEVNTNTSGWPDILESDKDGRHLILRPSELPSN